MNDVQMWILGILCTAVGACIAGGTIFAFIISGRVSEGDSKNSERIIRLETKIEFWLDSLGLKAAHILHSPDDHLGIDGYLDIYIKHHHDMSYLEWDEFSKICSETAKNPKASKLEQAQALFLAELAKHKMEGSSLTHASRLISVNK